MRESCIAVTFYLKDLKVRQESICKLCIDYSSSVKLGVLLGKSVKQNNVIENGNLQC